MPWFKKQKPVQVPLVKKVPKKKSIIKHNVSDSEFKKWKNNGNVKTITFDQDMLSDKGHFLKHFFATVTRYWPVASAASWTWKNLCNTKQTLKFIGGTPEERTRALLTITELNNRISPFSFVKGNGMDVIVSQFFHYLFTYGRFSSNIELNNSNSQIENIKILDPFNVLFDKQLNPFYQVDFNKAYRVNDNSFYYNALNMDTDNPYGFAFIETAWSLMEIADQMLSDMKHSSSNAGLPRLHIKITQPEKSESEDSDDYVKRMSSYFNSYIDQLSDIAPDDNFYSWDDVEIGVAGGHPGQSFVWKTNRSLLDEDIIAAFHLFAWIVGKTASTTKNWVVAQFNVLMVEVETIQNQVSQYVNWIYNTELNLRGINNVKAFHHFELVRDPAAKDIAIADRFKISNSKSKVLAGYISVDDGAKELGYEEAHDKELIFKTSKVKDSDSPINKEDKVDDNSETLDILENISDKIDELNNKSLIEE